MGKGDIKSRKGKIKAGSFGNSRPKKKNLTSLREKDVVVSMENLEKKSSKKTSD